MNAKIELLKVARGCADSVVSNYPDTLEAVPISEATKGELGEGASVQVLAWWEVLKRAYGGLVTHYNNKEAFPDPPPEASVGGLDIAGLLESPTLKGLLDKLGAGTVGQPLS